MPKVSVNIPVFNDERYIKETLKSVLDQTFIDYEVILIDDGSTDGTAEIIKGISDPRIKYFYQKNQGIGAARNAALLRSQGEYIAFLDHDDLWLPEKLEKQIALLEARPEVGLVFSDTVFFNDHGDLYCIYQERKPPRGRVFGELLVWYFLSLETVVIRRSVLDEVGWFNPAMMMAEEYDLFMRIAYKFDLDYVDEPLAKYRLHQNNYSWGREEQAIAEERLTVTGLLRKHPEIYDHYRAGIRKRFEDLGLRQVILLWKAGKRKAALGVLGSVPGLSRRKLLLGLAITFLGYKGFSRFIKNPFLQR
jgi:glycosyltransferase involved in cell wall biosynthesis